MVPAITSRQWATFLNHTAGIQVNRNCPKRAAIIKTGLSSNTVRINVGLYMLFVANPTIIQKLNTLPVVRMFALCIAGAVLAAR